LFLVSSLFNLCFKLIFFCCYFHFLFFIFTLDQILAGQKARMPKAEFFAQLFQNLLRNYLNILRNFHLKGGIFYSILFLKNFRVLSEYCIPLYSVDISIKFCKISAKYSAQKIPLFSCAKVAHFAFLKRQLSLGHQIY
jgi:hypothetical protein